MDADPDGSGFAGAERPRAVAPQVRLVCRGVGVSDGGHGTVGGPRVGRDQCPHSWGRGVSVGANRGPLRVFASAGVGHRTARKSGGAQENHDFGHGVAGGSWFRAICGVAVADGTKISSVVVFLHVLRERAAGGADSRMGLVASTPNAPVDRGAAVLLSAEFLAALTQFWGPWKAITLHWVEAWIKLTA